MSDSHRSQKPTSPGPTKPTKNGLGCCLAAAAADRHLSGWLAGLRLAIHPYWLHLISALTVLVTDVISVLKQAWVDRFNEN